MIAGSIGRRYAKALLEIAKEQNQVDEYLSQLELFEESLKNSSELHFLLFDPAFEISSRKKVLDSVVKKMQLSTTVHNFLNLLIDHGRINFFRDILLSYRDLADEVLNRVHVQVTVPNKIPEEIMQVLKEKLEKATKRNVILEIFSNPDLLGGMVLKVKNEVFDSSIQTALAQLKEKMSQAPI